MLLTQRILDPFLNLTFSSWTPSGERYLQRLCRDGTAGRLSCLSWENKLVVSRHAGRLTMSTRATYMKSPAVRANIHMEMFSA